MEKLQFPPRAKRHNKDISKSHPTQPNVAFLFFLLAYEAKKIKSGIRNINVSNYYYLKNVIASSYMASYVSCSSISWL